MLGLHEKNLAYVRSTVPSFEAFKKWGPMMPAAKFGDEPWFLESSSMLARLGFTRVSGEETAAIRRAWTGVMHRADSVPRFWKEFSLASDPNHSIRRRLASNFLRAFTVLYFFFCSFALACWFAGIRTLQVMATPSFTGISDSGGKRVPIWPGPSRVRWTSCFRNCSVPLQHPCANRLFPPSGPPSRRDPGVDRTNAGTFLRLSLPLFRALLSTTFVRPPACDRRRSSRILVGRAFLYRPPARDAHHRCSFHLSEQTFERYLK